jgi:hypothetical protein
MKGYYDKYGFFILEDGSFYDPYGYYFDAEGYDEYGGFYDDYGYYVPGDDYAEEYYRSYAQAADHDEDEVSLHSDEYFDEDDEDEEYKEETKNLTEE